jgi:hypothetical protein
MFLHCLAPYHHVQSHPNFCRALANTERQSCVSLQKTLHLHLHLLQITSIANTKVNFVTTDCRVKLHLARVWNTSPSNECGGPT